MGKGRTAALLLAAIIAALALMRTATATHDADHKAFSGGATFKGLVVKTERTGGNITSVVPSWTTVDSRGFEIPAGESQLVVADFFAETSCTGNDFCLARIRIGRTLATAQELEPAVGGNFAIDRADLDGSEGHSMSRALCVRNATGSPLSITVWMEATRSSGGVTGFELDDWTLKIARNAPCSPTVNI